MGPPLSHPIALSAVALGAEEKIALVGNLDGTAQLCEAATGKAIGLPLRHKRAIRAVALSAKGEIALTGSVPTSVRALQRPDLKNPGLVAYFTLKLGGSLTPPDRFLITHFPGPLGTKWDVPVQDIGNDSAVALYWNPVEIAPGDHREAGFAYGLKGHPALEAGDKKKQFPKW